MIDRAKMHMTPITDEGTFTSNGVTKKLKYFAHHLFAFEARDLILTFSENSAITYLIFGGPYGPLQPRVCPKIGKTSQL